MLDCAICYIQRSLMRFLFYTDREIVIISLELGSSFIIIIIFTTLAGKLNYACTLYLKNFNISRKDLLFEVSVFLRLFHTLLVETG